jgi:hypothetical protein
MRREAVLDKVLEIRLGQKEIFSNFGCDQHLIFEPRNACKSEGQQVVPASLDWAIEF